MKPITPLLSNNGYGGRPSLRSSTGSISTSQRPQRKPSDIYDLKIKNAKLDQEIKILKTQLSRTKDRINQQSKMIAHTTGPKASVSGVQNKRQSTINNLSHSVTSAQNTLDTLNQQLEQMEKDDRNCYVEELRTEILIAFAEYQRIQDNLGESSSRNKNYQTLFTNADKKASQSSIEDKEFELSQLQQENANLIDKIKAYQTKCYRTKNESVILTRENDGESIECSIQEVEDANERHQNKLNKYNELSQKENEEYDAAIAYLNKIINYQRSIIADHLQGKELPDPSEKPKYEGPQQHKDNENEEEDNKEDNKQENSNENQENENNDENKDEKIDQEAKQGENNQEQIENAPKDDEKETNQQNQENQNPTSLNNVIADVADDVVDDVQDVDVVEDIQA